MEKDERSFIIKRNLSNAATHVLTVRTPGWLLEQACLTPIGNWTAQPCLDGGMAPWRAAPAMQLSEDLPAGTSHSHILVPCVNHVQTAFTTLFEADLSFAAHYFVPAFLYVVW